MLRLAPGRWLTPQLHLLSWLGEDLHGDIFLAELRPQGRAVSVKVLNSEACQTPEYLDRFRRTVERVMGLSHRNLASVHAFGIFSPQPEGAVQTGLGPPRRAGTPAPPRVPWLASDVVEGPDLRSYFIDGVPLAALLSLLMPVAELIDQAAAAGIVHGEISPANLIVVSDEVTPRAVLVDLGLAKPQADSPLDVPLLPGMLCYRSPEQCVSACDEDPAADRYALATILYEGVAGRPPFVSSDPAEILRAHKSAPVPPLRTLVPTLGRAQALDAFFVRALAKQPEARFPTATTMMEEFVLAAGVSVYDEGQLKRRRRSHIWYLLRDRDDAERALNVVVGPRALLGKQPECDVVCQALPSPKHDAITSGISREHAVLIWLDDRLSVLDRSCNGTYVNGRRVGSRLTPLPERALLRMGEHLTLLVEKLPALQESGEVPGVLLFRQDDYAAGSHPTLMLWQKIPLQGSPLSRVGLEFGHLWVALRELWWSGHPKVLWQRQDGSLVTGPAPLRHGDRLACPHGVILVEH